MSDTHLINGEWTSGTGAAFATHDPSTGQHSWSGNAASDVEVEAACAAARNAFHQWATTSVNHRIEICQRFRDLLKQHADDLARIICREVGKPLWEARTEVASMANKIDISVQAYHARTGHTSSAVADGHAVVRHRPHGVFGVFGPYNFPGHLPNGHIVPALIAGNTIVFKPSEFAPQTAIRTAQLWIAAGLPAGVLNLINGGADTGAALSRQPTLDGILFTGSYRTGAMLHHQLAGQPGKILALEMGGNNALLAWKVSNLDAAVHHIVQSAFISAGQRCTCARRLIIENSEAGERLMMRLIEVTQKIEIGRFNLLPAPFMGPVISVVAAQQLLAAQAMLIERGAQALLPMRQLHEGTGFVSPAILDVTHVDQLPDEEWFGPLLQVIRVNDFDSALAAVNATEYGLAASLLSDDRACWERFVVEAHAGIVNWNRPTTGAASTAPFGGIGKSGNHRPSAFYAADYCAYPVASIESSTLEMPMQLSPGLHFQPDNFQT